MRTGGDELELATNQPTTTGALTDGTHAFRIRRNQAIANAIAAVTISLMAKPRKENRSRRLGGTSPLGGIPVAAATRNGAPDAGYSHVRKFTRRFSDKTRSVWKTSVLMRTGSAKSTSQRPINTKVGLVRIDLPVHWQDVHPRLAGLQVDLVPVLVREGERVDEVRP